MVAGFAAGASAQNWTHYVPQEGDFRVLMPDQPTRQNTAYGSVEFMARGGEQRYYVIRHPAGQVQQLQQARDQIRRRLSEDRSVRDLTDDTGGLEPNEFYYRIGRTRSLHRVILDGGRFYELVSQIEDDDGLNRQFASDFFSSFQMGLGLGRFSVLRNVPTPDTCSTRTNVYARRFCEYLTCLAPGQESNPICTALPRLR